MTEPHVTIITICRNESTAVSDTISSVLSQSYPGFEYIIKDGASTDDTVEIARGFTESFEAKGISFRVISEKDGGIYDAMNSGVGYARGKWINFMNAGDRFYSADTLKNVFENKENENADLLYGDAIEEEFGEYYFFRKCPELIEQRMPFSHQSVFAKKELLTEFPFDIRYPIAADYNFLLLAYQKGYLFRDTGEIVAVVSKSGVSTVRLKDTYLESVRLRRDRGISQPTDEELKRGMWKIDLKQFGMDHFPTWLKYCIRKVQRLIRHQRRADIYNKASRG